MDRIEDSLVKTDTPPKCKECGKSICNNPKVRGLCPTCFKEYKKLKNNNRV